MGLGDWVMATAQVKKMHAEYGFPVHVVGFNGRPQWSPVFENNPKITQTLIRECRILKNCGGVRPYIQGKTVRRWWFKEWDIEPGEIFLSAGELAFAEPYRGKVLIEPTTKVASCNKAWLWARWQEVVDRAGYDFIQVGPSSTPRLRRVGFVETTFRQAMAVLSVCRGYLGPEGALHHAAAALNVPAVVLWSHFIEPRFTGYATQRNIRHAGPYCGSRFPCSECRESMAAISADEVIENLGDMLDSASRHLAA